MRSCASNIQQKYGFFRPIAGEVVQNYLTCGEMKNGFASVRCGDCSEEYLLAFS
ncbi:MAG: transposase zinc-binding domain-containing protein [Planctomycetia bacterium]|nr:transposase zinc-binding domain-containing protein [Planctomycetia bacterium]